MKNVFFTEIFTITANTTELPSQGCCNPKKNQLRLLLNRQIETKLCEGRDDVEKLSEPQFTGHVDHAGFLLLGFP